ncbi:hypothetical protein CM15mP35_09640 [bacterium]|nr:MAG: hypothetical protein CM15mP35_09640 [bacterium]
MIFMFMAILNINLFICISNNISNFISQVMIRGNWYQEESNAPSLDIQGPSNYFIVCSHTKNPHGPKI